MTKKTKNLKSDQYHYTPERFFSGDEIDNIAKDLNISAGLIQEQLFKSIDYSQFIFRIAEILEVTNVEALDITQDLFFDDRLSAFKKNELVQKIKRKEKITHKNFSGLKRNNFSAFVKKITLSTDDQLRQRRIGYAFLDSVFFDLNEKNNLFSSRLIKLVDKQADDISARSQLISILEKNSFSLASRDLTKLYCDKRASASFQTYRKGKNYPILGDLYWNTSLGIQNNRVSTLPQGVTLVSTSPDPQTNFGYLFSMEEKKHLEHYFKCVMASEIKKGNCFENTVEQFNRAFNGFTMPRVDEYLTKKFGKNWDGLSDVIITGIGGNEMVAHLIQTYAGLYNSKIRVHLLTFPSKWAEEIDKKIKSFFNEKKELKPENLVVIALSRSGKTYETVKTCEFIAQCFGHINLIGVANGGRLVELAKQYKGIAVDFPLGIAGRLSSFNTPVFSLPMAIIDRHSSFKIKEKFIKAILKYDETLSLKNPNNIAWELAKKIYLSAYINGMNLKIYQGSNSKMTMACFRHMEQVVMEGIKHNISCMLPKSMPDAAHFNMEQTLKFGENFYHFWIIEKNPLKGEKADILINRLNVNEQLSVLLKGQFEKIKIKSPLDILLIDDIYDVETQAFIYKLIENTMYFLARLLGDDPEGNPDVKDVRDLSSKAEEIVLDHKMKGKFDIIDFYYELEKPS